LSAPFDSTNFLPKILIANRGEIACRIIDAAHDLGIETVAVYSSADKNAQHVKKAGQSVCIGPPSPSESYLVSEKLIDAALATGARGIHPGYGFLSENSGFAQLCVNNSIKF